MHSVFVLYFFQLICIAFARQGFGPNDQEWGHITVRPKAHMFYWLYHTTAKTADRPLVIWLQGGPGAASSAFGNFDEIGPIDANLNARNLTWIQDVNVLFVDNPVGTGFSYVESKDALTHTNAEIAQDFLVFLKGFYDKFEQFKNVPLYIFAESYGGKMAVEIALLLHNKLQDGEFDVSLNGVGLIDSWISPIDSVMSWAPYLLHFGLVDNVGFDKIQKSALATLDAVKKENFSLATDLWGETEILILQYAHGVDFYNVLKKISSTNFAKTINVRSTLKADLELNDLMQGKVRTALGLTHIKYYLQNGEVFDAQKAEFMKPVTHLVEELLNKTDIKVAVINGQLDLIVDTPGTINWVNNLHFNNMDDFKTKNRLPLVCYEVIEGFYKKAGNFAMYWVNRAGHMVPADNPATMRMILGDILQINLE